jgi:cyclase
LLTKRIIPCLDIDKGRVVKGTSFLSLKDAGDPRELSNFYNKQGADELVFLDITASSEYRSIILDVVKQVSSEVFIPLTVGGGIKSLNDIRNLLNAGADKVSINTSAIENPNIIRESSKEFGSQCIVVAIDAKRNKNSWNVFTHGGRVATQLDAIQWAKKVNDLGAGELLITSMDEDGQQKGYDIPLLKTIEEKVTIPIIASGGAGNLEHMLEALTIGKCDAVLAASIFHYGKYTIKQVKDYLHSEDVSIRLI